MENNWIVNRGAPVLVTGAAGFVGSRVVGSLLRLGFENVRCFVRPSGDRSLLDAAIRENPGGKCEAIEGNLLSRSDCERAVADVAVVYHLVAGRGKSFPGCFQGSVVTTRNLLEAVVQRNQVKRFVNVSSFAVYSNLRLRPGSVLDETCPTEDDMEKRFDAYVYGKVKQDEMIVDYHRRTGLPFTIVRPGIVFGPGKKAIPGTVGIDTFGFFMHLGGGGEIPLTYVDNCADAVVLAGLVPGVEGETFNIVDDDLPTSRAFLRAYKKRVHRFRSIWVPYRLTYFMCSLWERYAVWSKGQLPPVFNRRTCAFSWKGHRYTNHRLKDRLGWKCRVSMDEALSRYFAYQKDGGKSHD